MFIFFLLAASFVVAEEAFAATYYVCNSAATCNAASSGWATGNNSNACTTKGAPCLTLQGAFGKMLSGDTLIIGDGTYTGTSNAISSSNYPPYGSAGNYTIIKAENDGGPLFDGAGVRLEFASGDRAYYYQFEGLIWGNTNFVVNRGHHVKVLRCGAYNAGSGNIQNFRASEGSSYILFENCYAWGEGRYKFIAYQADYIIFRQCVGRMDKEDALGQNIAGMAIYSSDNVLVQNSIIIDSDIPNYWTNTQSWNGCIHVPVTNMSGSNTTIDSFVCLNSDLGGIQEMSYEGAGVPTDTNLVVKNSVFWRVDATFGGHVHFIRGINPTVTNNTFGNSHVGTYYLSTYISQSMEITNSLFYDIGPNISAQWAAYGVAHDYNTYYASTGIPTLSAHEYSNRNPIWNASTNPTGALKYITRIESGSNHSGIGSGGADIGANQIYMVGAPGTLWGETGYNTVQTTKMWPFPNEALIKAKMAAYTYPGINGARGFAAPGNGLYGGPITLTSYIWEYLGNSCPADVCSYNSGTLAAPINLIIKWN